VVGFTLTTLSFFFSVLHLHLPLRWHIPLFSHGPGAHGVGAHGIGAHGAGVHGATHGLAAHGAVVHVAATHLGASVTAKASTQSSSAKLSWLNPSSALAFLAWFGGTGYLLTQYYAVWYVLGLVFSILAGFAGAASVSWFLVKVLLPHEVELRDADFELAGTLAKVTSSIREGGTGEITYSQDGARKCAGARSSDGKQLEKGAEVVVERYEKGIAYVARWEEWAK